MYFDLKYKKVTVIASHSKEAGLHVADAVCVPSQGEDFGE